MDTKDINSVILQNSKPRNDGVIELNQAAAGAVQELLQRSYQMGAVMQRITYMQNETEELRKENVDMRKKLNDLEKQTHNKDRQIDDYGLLIMQMIRSMRHAEDRRKLAKIFFDHADTKNLKYDAKEFNRIWVEQSGN